MIPDFQTVMLPLLKISSDGKPRKRAEYEQLLADQFSVTDEERRERLPSGSPRFSNRVAWAALYLRRAGFLDVPQRGQSIITQAGHELLKNPPSRIDIRFLSQFSGFDKFRDKRLSDTSTPAVAVDQGEEENPPEEMIEKAISSMRTALVEQILTIVREKPFGFLEDLVVKLVVKMGYGGSKLAIEEQGEVVGGSGDGGIDGIVYEDLLGLDMIYLQAKRYKESSRVGRPDIQKFVGALMDKRARKGIFITTSSFSQEAIDYAERSDYRIVLIDGVRLANLMIDHDLGVTKKASYSLKELDQDFYEDA